MYTSSKKELLNLIKQKGTLSVDEAVRHTRLAKSTLRQHFMQLERDGCIRREYVRSGPGRPSLQYQLTVKGNRLFPSSESDLMRELLKYLREKGDEQTIEEFFDLFWKERLQSARKHMDSVSKQDMDLRLTALMKFLDEEGFMPEFNRDEESNTLTIKECNCPFSEVVKETRLPCKLEAIFYQNLFGGKAKRTSYIADGDFSCTYEISLPKG
ncbi:MAG: DeoR family transcriptional regulator [Balneolaceae bacterium]